MSSFECLREFVNERLTAAAEEILGVFIKAIVEYEEEIDRQRRLLDIVWKPEIKLHRIELPQQHVCEEEEDLADQQLCIQERSSSLDQEDPEPPQIKEKQEELCTSQEGEQLVVKQETPTDEESDHSEDQTMCLNPDDTLIEAEAESAVIIPVISSVVSVATSDHQLLSGDQEEQKQQKRHHKTVSHINNVSSSNLSEDNCNADHGEKSLKCDTCGKMFKFKSILQRHQRIHTGPFTCKTCGIVIRRRSNMTVHMRSHTSEKRLSCKICGIVIGRRSNLTVHMRTHTGEKPFVCNTCQKRFAQRSTYNKHMRIHTGEKPFVCNTCGKRFADPSACKRHMRTHTDEKPFTCKICGSAFGRNDNLKHHMKSHTGLQQLHLCY